MKKILIADDNKALRDSLDILLSDTGYNTILAIDGVMSYLRAATYKPDLILLDVFMPYADGLSVAKEISEYNIPIIFMTGTDNKDIHSAIKAMKPAGFLIKPFETETILKMVKEILG